MVFHLVYFAAVPFLYAGKDVSVIFVNMEMNDTVFDQLAHLARLQFSTAEKEEIQHDLQRMVAFVEKLNELDTNGIPPLLHMSNAVNIWREDTVAGSVSRDEALRNAPVQDGQFFKVPKVIKK